MLTFISVIHILAALILIGLVLAQDSKSGGMGMLGGGSSSVFGASGGANILVKATRTVAIVFAATCIGLTIMSANSTKSVIDAHRLALLLMQHKKPLRQTWQLHKTQLQWLKKLLPKKKHQLNNLN